jgi:hypothetical protein
MFWIILQYSVLRSSIILIVRGCPYGHGLFIIILFVINVIAGLLEGTSDYSSRCRCDCFWLSSRGPYCDGFGTAGRIHKCSYNMHQKIRT